MLLSYRTLHNCPLLRCPLRAQASTQAHRPREQKGPGPCPQQVSTRPAQATSRVLVEPTSFQFEDTRLVGDLYLPAKSTRPLAGIMVTGTWTSDKEQMADRYAAKLAEHGPAGMSFHFTGFGLSGDDQRDVESPERKSADLAHVVAFLASHPRIDAHRVGALAICASACTRPRRCQWTSTCTPTPRAARSSAQVEEATGHAAQRLQQPFVRQTEEFSMPMPNVTVTLDTSADGDQRRAVNLGTIHRFFDCMRRKDIDAWIDLWAEDACLLIPYPPHGAGFPPSIDGRDAILPGFQQLFAHFASYDADLHTIYPSLDPDILIVEWSVEAHLIEGPVYRGDNITVFRFDHGKLRYYHDYFNPELFRAVVETTATASTSIGQTRPPADSS